MKLFKQGLIILCAINLFACKAIPQSKFGTSSRGISSTETSNASQAVNTFEIIEQSEHDPDFEIMSFNDETDDFGFMNSSSSQSSSQATTTNSINFANKLGLIAAIDQSTGLISSIQANTGFQSVYSKSLSVTAGDVFRIRAQIELTNDNPSPVAGVIRILANGNQISFSQYENVIVDQVHHLPYWVDATFTATSTGSVHFEAQIEAQRSDDSPSLKIESSGYGHLFIEHYRPLTSSNLNSAYGVVDIVSTKTATASSYGGVAWNQYQVAAVSKVATSGDLFRMMGQTTSVYQSYDMHASALWANGTQITPWATQDHVWNTGYNPNFLDGVYVAPSSSTINFTATMHTSLGSWNPVGTTHILGLQMRKATTTNYDSLKFLKSSIEKRNSSAFYVLSNAGWHNVQSEVVNLKAGDIVRLRTQKQFIYPESDTNAVFCETQVIVNMNSTSISASTASYKYMNNQMGALPLYNDDVFIAPADGGYAIYSQALCASQMEEYVNVNTSSISVDIFGK